MHHDTIQRTLFELYDGEVAGIERREIEAHLLQCAECRRVHAGWRHTAKALFRREAPPASEAFVQRVLDRLPRSAPRRPMAPWVIRLRRLVPAAGLAALMLLMLRPAESPVSVDGLLLADGRERTSTQLVLASAAPTSEDVLDLIMEDAR